MKLFYLLKSHKEKKKRGGVQKSEMTLAIHSQNLS